LKPDEIDGYDIISEAQAESEDHTYHECPVWKHKCNRSFVVRSPIDFEIEIKDGELIYNLPQFYPVIISDEKELDTIQPVIQLKFPTFYFWTNTDNLWFELLDHPMTSLNNNMVIVGGWWNLGNYPRSASVPIRFVDRNKKVSIKKEDPLYRVRFYGEDLNTGIKLIKSSILPNDVQIQNLANNPRKAGKSGMNRRLFAKKQCPFKGYLNL